MIFTLSVALMALSLTSCGSGIDTEEEALPWCKEDVCDEGGASLLKCDIDTGRTTLKLCPFGCSNGTCNVSPTAECFTNADCPATKPVCASGTCIANDTPAPPAPECFTNADCPATKPVCASGTCIANDTPAPPAPECNINSDCPAAKPVCSNGTCIANDTPAPPAPECKTNNDCKDPTKPVCSNGTCVANDTPEPPAPECKTHDDCKDPTKPVCINGACSNTCDKDTFAEVCIGSTGYYCNEGKPAILECASAGLVCEKIKNENYIDCYDAKTACTKVGATDTLCQEIEGYVLSGPAQCKEMESGAKHFVSTASSFSDYTQCNPITQTCDAQGKKCITYGTTTDTTCSEDTAPKCENGKLVTCENLGSSTAPSYKLVNKDCSKYNGGVCATADGAETICAPSQSTCTQGQREQMCVDYQDLGFLFVQFTTECKQYSNNTWQPAVSYIICEGKCNADNTACEGETPKPECTKDADCPATRPVCDSGICVEASTPGTGCTSHSDCPAAKPVCENGKCVENTTVVDVACQGVTCAKGTCDRGVCVTDEMKAAIKGAPCDGKTFGEFCNGDSMVYCSMTNKVVVTDCSNDGGCSIVKENDNGQVVVTSWCNGPSNQCKNDNQEIPYCGTDTDGTVFESSYICIKNTEGKFTAQDQSLYEDGYTPCATTCNADNTACQ